MDCNAQTGIENCSKLLLLLPLLLCNWNEATVRAQLMFAVDAVIIVVVQQ